MKTYNVVRTDSYQEQLEKLKPCHRVRDAIRGLVQCLHFNPQSYPEVWESTCAIKSAPFLIETGMIVKLAIYFTIEAGDCVKLQGVLLKPESTQKAIRGGKAGYTHIQKDDDN